MTRFLFSLLIAAFASTAPFNVTAAMGQSDETNDGGGDSGAATGNRDGDDCGPENTRGLISGAMPVSETNDTSTDRRSEDNRAEAYGWVGLMGFVGLGGLLILNCAETLTERFTLKLRYGRSHW